MPTRRRLLPAGMAGVALALLLLAAWVWVASERELRKVYPVPVVFLDVPTGVDAVARGEHLVRSVATCTLCHGDDLGGAVYAESVWMGVVAGPNLTTGEGGLGASLDDRDLVRAIRYGVRSDGTSLVAMPSEVFTHMSDADLGAIVAYLRQLPPVNRVVPATRFAFVGRALLAAGRLKILVAPKTLHDPSARPVEASTSAEYGKYLANIAGCHGCHGYGLSGGRVAGPPNLPPASNLTPEGIGTWSQADFVLALREGRRPDGSRLDPFMPWRTYRLMTDEELGAIWLYLRSVPPKPSGNK